MTKKEKKQAQLRIEKMLSSIGMDKKKYKKLLEKKIERLLEEKKKLLFDLRLKNMLCSKGIESPDNN